MKAELKERHDRFVTKINDQVVLLHVEAERARRKEWKKRDLTFHRCFMCACVRAYMCVCVYLFFRFVFVCCEGCAQMYHLDILDYLGFIRSEELLYKARDIVKHIDSHVEKLDSEFQSLVERRDVWPPGPSYTNPHESTRNRSAGKNFEILTSLDRCFFQCFFIRTFQRISCVDF